MSGHIVVASSKPHTPSNDTAPLSQPSAVRFTPYPVAVEEVAHRVDTTVRAKSEQSQSEQSQSAQSQPISIPKPKKKRLEDTRTPTPTSSPANSPTIYAKPDPGSPDQFLLELFRLEI